MAAGPDWLDLDVLSCVLMQDDFLFQLVREETEESVIVL